VDPAVARLLIATIGLFPVGSTIRLSDGRTAIVVDTTGPARTTRPLVMIVADANGPTERTMIELSESRLGISGTMDPVDMDLNVGQFIFA